jgi:hypothetical protein
MKVNVLFLTTRNKISLLLGKWKNLVSCGYIFLFALGIEVSYRVARKARPRFWRGNAQIILEPNT